MTAPKTPTGKTPRGKSRPFVMLFTSLLNDTDLILAGQDARGLYPYLLLHSGEQGLDGYLPSDPRAIQLFAHLDGGAKAVEAAIETLVDINKLERHEDGRLYIRTWTLYQADLGGSDTRSQTMVLENHKRGNHKTPKDGCSLCAQGDVAAPAQATATPVQQPVAVAVPASNEAADIKEKVRSRCDQVVTLAEESGEDIYTAYVTLYEFVTDQAPRFTSVKGIGEATLLNVVIDHAAHRFLSPAKAISDRTLSKLHGIRKEHGIEVLATMARSADMEKPMGYFLACYRDEQKAAA